MNGEDDRVVSRDRSTRAKVRCSQERIPPSPLRRSTALSLRVVLAVTLCTIPICEAVSQDQRRPLVVVPGIVGSVLQDNQRRTIWGSLRSLSKSNFKKLNLLPDHAAPVDLIATDILRRVPVLFGRWSIGGYAGLIDFLRDLGYEEDRNLHVFHYDWRRTNFATAYSAAPRSLMG